MKSLNYPEALFIYNSESSMDTQFLVAGMAWERPWRNPWEVFMVWVCGCSPLPTPPRGVRHRSTYHLGSWECVALEVKANGSVNR